MTLLVSSYVCCAIVK